MLRPVGRQSGLLAVAAAVAIHTLPVASAAAAAVETSIHGEGARVRVAILVRVPSRLQEHAAARREELSPVSYRRGIGEPRSVPRQQALRRAAIHSLASAARRTAIGGVSAYRAIVAAGGKIEEISTAGTAVVARVPRGALQAL